MLERQEEEEDVDFATIREIDGTYIPHNVVVYLWIISRAAIFMVRPDAVYVREGMMRIKICAERARDLTCDNRASDCSQTTAPLNHLSSISKLFYIQYIIECLSNRRDAYVVYLCSITHTHTHNSWREPSSTGALVQIQFTYNNKKRDWLISYGGNIKATLEVKRHITRRESTDKKVNREAVLLCS